MSRHSVDNTKFYEPVSRREENLRASRPHTSHSQPRKNYSQNDIAVIADVPCMNCHQLISIRKIDDHSQVCLQVSEKVFKIENNMSLRDIENKLSNLIRAFDALVKKLSQEKGNTQENMDKIQSCNKAVVLANEVLGFSRSSDMIQIRLLKGIIEEINVLIKQVESVPQIMIYVERMKYLSRMKCEELQNVDRQRLNEWRMGLEAVSLRQSRVLSKTEQGVSNSGDPGLSPGQSARSIPKEESMQNMQKKRPSSVTIEKRVMRPSHQNTFLVGRNSEVLEDSENQSNGISTTGDSFKSSASGQRQVNIKKVERRSSVGGSFERNPNLRSNPSTYSSTKMNSLSSHPKDNSIANDNSFRSNQQIQGLSNPDLPLRTEKPLIKSGQSYQIVQTHIPRVVVPQLRTQNIKGEKSYRQKLEEKLLLRQQELDEISKLVTLHKTKTEELQRKSVEPFKRLSNSFHARPRDSSLSGSRNSINMQNESTNNAAERSPNLKEGLTRQNVERISRNDNFDNRYIQHNNQMLHEINSDIDRGLGSVNRSTISNSVETNSQIDSVHKQKARDFSEFDDFVSDDISQNAKKFKEAQMQFYSKCLTNKLKLESGDLAHKIPVAILFQTAIDRAVKPEDWNEFILESFKHPEVFLDPKKTEKKKSQRGIQNKLREIANHQRIKPKDKRNYESIDVIVE